MIHGVLFSMQFKTAIVIGIHNPIDMNIVECFKRLPRLLLLRNYGML